MVVWFVGFVLCGTQVFVWDLICYGKEVDSMTVAEAQRISVGGGGKGESAC